MAADLYPWLLPLYDRLIAQLANGKLPHSLLLSGPPSFGKMRLIEAFVSRLLCSEESSPCGRCHQCDLLIARTHPDYLLIQPEDSRQILIDQVRGLIDWAAQTSQQGGQKVCVINPAHRMNVQAANSLLKCLEEPPASTTIILITDEPNRLLATIRSRCQHIGCQAPERDDAIAWLAQNHQSAMDPALLLDIADGLPLRAVEVIDDDYLELRLRIAKGLAPALSSQSSPIQMAADFAGDDPGVVLDIMYQLVADTVNRSAAAEQWRNRDLAEQLQKLESIGLQARFEFLDRLVKARGILGGTSNANSHMLFEWVLNP